MITENIPHWEPEQVQNHLLRNPLKDSLMILSSINLPINEIMIETRHCFRFVDRLITEVKTLTGWGMGEFKYYYWNTEPKVMEELRMNFGLIRLGAYECITPEQNQILRLSIDDLSKQKIASKMDISKFDLAMKIRTLEKATAKQLPALQEVWKAQFQPETLKANTFHPINGIDAIQWLSLGQEILDRNINGVPVDLIARDLKIDPKEVIRLLRFASIIFEEP